MSRLEETFEAILGSVRTKIQNVEAEDAFLPPHDADPAVPETDAATEIEEPVSVTPLEPSSSDLAEPPARGAGSSSATSDAAAGESGWATDRDGIERAVRYATGTHLVPNYVSDYLLKNLSLGEQAVFSRLFRLSAGFYKKTEPITIRSLGEACGLSPKFTATIVKSLATKRLVRVILVNPLTKKVRLKLVLPSEVEKKIVLCGVCHDLILEDEPWRTYPISRPVKNRAQAIVAHARCVEGEPFFAASAEVERADE